MQLDGNLAIRFEKGDVMHFCIQEVLILQHIIVVAIHSYHLLPIFLANIQTKTEYK